MTHRGLRWLGALAVITAASSSVWAAGHREWTIVPLGTFSLHEGDQQVAIDRPYDRFDVIPSPIVLLALFDPSTVAATPVKVQIAFGERPLATWSLERPGQIYIIGVDELDELVGKRNAQVKLDIRVTGLGEGLARVMASGAPDMRLAGDDWVGPLEERVDSMESGLAREYLSAVVATAEPTLTSATSAFERLAASSDPLVGRFARDKLRRIRFAQAQTVADNSFGTAYRMGLYAQQCGLSRDALRMYEAAAKMQSTPWLKSDSLYRLGEMMERCGYPISDVAEVMGQAGEAAQAEPNVWDIWVPILMREYYEEQDSDGKSVVKSRVMSQEDVATLKRDWDRVVKMVYGASGGCLVLNTRYIEVPDNRRTPYAVWDHWLPGPSDAFVEPRGAVDSVVSFRPGGASCAGGADCGPNGASMVDVGPTRTWEVFLHEWNHTFDWTRIVAEAGDGCPITHHSDGCGHQPIPTMGYGHLSCMRYWVTPAMYQRSEAADPDPGVGYVLNWRIGTRQPVTAETNPDGSLPRHATKFGPEETKDVRRTYVASNEPFIDLLALPDESGLKAGDWFVTPATAYVWSPREQLARFWLGHNDGLAMWLNGELAHRGDYYSLAKFADQNWPNMAATAAVLRQGWNRIDVAVEAWPAPMDKGHGFAIRLCDFNNQPLPDIRVAEEATDVSALAVASNPAPQVGWHYKWDEVRDDYYRKLPRITPALLREYFGLPESDQVVIKSNVGPTHGFLVIGVARDVKDTVIDGVPVAAATRDWDPARDRDMQLNNVLDYNREAVAVYPFQRNGASRHLLVMRPEAIDAYLTCLRESPAAAKTFNGRPPRERILGYLLTGEGEGRRVWIVAETQLSTPLPVDEEDVLAPLP